MLDSSQISVLFRDSYSLLDSIFYFLSSTACVAFFTLRIALFTLANHDRATCVLISEVFLLPWAAWGRSSTVSAGLGLLVLDLLWNMYESVLNVVTSFGTSFKESHAEFLGQSSALLSGNNFSVYLICFVSNQNLFDILASMKFNLADPVTNVVETFFLSAVIG